MRKIEDLRNDFYSGVLEQGIFTTENENGNTVVVEIMEDYMKLRTFQDNGWIRINVYHKDHTVEEYYAK